MGEAGDRSREGSSDAVGRGRGRLGCLQLAVIVVVASLFLVGPAFGVADKLAYELDGGCVSPPFTLDACRDSAAFWVANRGEEPVDIVMTRAGRAPTTVLEDVTGSMTSYSLTLYGGKCEPTVQLVARTRDGRVVAERTGICRRETWSFGGPAPSG